MEPPKRALFLDLLAAYFAGPLQVVAGQSLFTGEHPASASDAVVLRSTGGSPDLALFGLRWTHVQVMTRSRDPLWASNRAWMVHELAHQMNRRILDDGAVILGTYPDIVSVRLCRPVSEPADLGHDPADGYVYTVNLRFQLGVTARE
ncbi:MAG: hypothetical protein J0I12_11125 [Candidatus Eremiobacteraeota bacterium]|nr:hypothetical protein [Candidatus Eremiobacteraeota bacterium]